MKLSIIVPVYNVEKYLKQCIESVLTQSFTDFELILIDDGSTDESLSICKFYEKEDKRIRVLLCEHTGPYYARKIGVKAAEGEYITFLDADDFISELSYFLAYEDMEKQIDVISFDIMRYNTDGSIKYDGCEFKEKVYNRQEIEKEILPKLIWNSGAVNFGIDPSLCNKIFKSELLKKIYAYEWEINFQYGEDVAIVYPLLLDSTSISIRHGAYYYHRQRNTGIIPDYILDNQFLDKLFNLYKHLMKTMKFGSIFKSQIELFYAHSVQLVNYKYHVESYIERELFPYDRILKGSKVIIYGAGNVGKSYVRQLKLINFCECILWVDQNYHELGCEVHNPKEIRNFEYDAIVIAIKNLNIKKQIQNDLLKMGVMEEKIV